MIPRNTPRIKYLREHTEGIENIVLSCHMHNDLGMASPIRWPALRRASTDRVHDQRHRRARGHASMEECVMALKTRADHFGIGCNIDTTQIYRASRMIQTITGVSVAPTKPIVAQRLCA